MKTKNKDISRDANIVILLKENSSGRRKIIPVGST